MKKETVIYHYGYHKTAKRLKIARYLTLLLLLAFTLLLFFAFRRDMTLNHFRYLLYNLDFSPNAALSSGDTVYYDGDTDASYGFVAGGLACLTDTRVFVTDRSSGTTFSEYHGYASPRAVFSKNYMAVYDRTGSSLAVYNAFARLESFTYEGTVLAAALADDGTLAVAVAEEESYYSTVYVYNSRFEQVNKLSKYKYVTALALSDDGKLLATGSVFPAESGIMASELLLLEVGTKEALATHSFEGEVLWRLSFSENGGVTALGDRALRCFDRKGNEISSVKYEKGAPVLSYVGKNRVLLAFRGADGRSDTLCLYNREGVLLKELLLDGENCLSVGEDLDHLWLITDGGTLMALSSSGETVHRGLAEAEGVIVSGSDRAYFATSSSAKRLMISDEQEEKQGDS